MKTGPNNARRVVWAIRKGIFLKIQDSLLLDDFPQALELQIIVPDHISRHASCQMGSFSALAVKSCQVVPSFRILSERGLPPPPSVQNQLQNLNINTFHASFPISPVHHRYVSDSIRLHPTTTTTPFDYHYDTIRLLRNDVTVCQAQAEESIEEKVRYNNVVYATYVNIEVRQTINSSVIDSRKGQWRDAKHQGRRSDGYVVAKCILLSQCAIPETV